LLTQAVYLSLACLLVLLVLTQAEVLAYLPPLSVLAMVGLLALVPMKHSRLVHLATQAEHSPTVLDRDETALI
jgi:hypothetical protein